MSFELTFNKHHLELLLAKFKGNNGSKLSDRSNLNDVQYTMDKEMFCTTFLEIINFKNLHSKSLHKDCSDLFQKV